MGNKVKDIDIENRTYYFFKYIINKKIVDPNNMKVGYADQRFEICKD